jgi:hypothetical protein
MTLHISMNPDPGRSDLSGRTRSGGNLMTGTSQIAVLRTGPISMTRASRIFVRSLIVCACLLAAQGTSLAIDYSWIGGSGSWDTSSNWTPSGTPTTGDRRSLGCRHHRSIR